MNDLIPVPFRNATLFLADVSGVPYTPMKPIVEGMGLSWQPQHEKLRQNKARWGITEIVIPTDGGQQAAICLPLRKLPGWLMTISPNKVRPEIRETVIAYQNECDDALWDYWTKGQAVNPRGLPQTYIEALEALVASEKAKLALEQDNALLNTIIDNEFGYSSILRAARHLGVHESTFYWPVLKRATLEAGLEIKRVPSPRYAYQNLYPITVFERCYPQYDFSGLQPEAVATRATKLLSGNISIQLSTAH